MKVTQVLLFEVPGTGTGFSADVEIDGAFSVQLGVDDKWSFAPEAQAPEGMSSDLVAEKSGAFEAVCEAVESGQDYE